MKLLKLAQVNHDNPKCIQKFDKCVVGTAMNLELTSNAQKCKAIVKRCYFRIKIETTDLKLKELSLTDCGYDSCCEEKRI